MKKWLLALPAHLCLVSSLAIAQGAANTVETLTLEKVIKIAIENAVATAQAKNNYELTGAQLLQAYGQFLPSLAVSATYTPLNSNQRINPTTLPGGQVIFPLFGQQTTSIGFSLNSSLNLFNGLADQAALQNAIHARESAGYTLKRAKQDIAFSVAQAYLQILLNQELLAIAQENLKVSQERLRQLQEQARLGARTIADLYQQEAQKAADELAVIRAENTLRNSKLALIRQARLDPTKEYKFESPPIDTTLLGAEYQDEARLIAVAQEQRADLKAAQESLTAASWAITQARGTFLPALNLNFTLFTNGFSVFNQSIDGNTIPNPVLPTVGEQLNKQISFNIGLQLSWTIFDRFSTNLRAEQALINYRNQELQYEDLKIRVVAEVRQALGDYQAALKQLESTSKGLLSAKQAYETIQKRYEVGSATFVEVAAAQAALVRAQSDRAQALFNFTFQKKILEYFLGSVDIDAF
ncbi:MAG: TolC family protein [Candidatus Thermochlorobacter aerophilum]|jgi:outer membrane protein|uniref:TolC family protein n=1 Tax=Candidatus Thermochlorobacter aerophilus TaxID=1868324 RepID=A0A395M3Q6_9BACT|nr:MAG: TolC family protein [Candidatus Thermochlorobacter aerophilum]